MTVLEQVEKALEPFAAAATFPRDRETDERDGELLARQWCERAAEALAALRRWREQAEQGPWRVGSKIPLNVYEGDRPVCQCHSEEDAKRIVAACNGQLAGIPKELRETLIEALRLCAEDVTPYWREFADARKQLEAL